MDNGIIQAADDLIRPVMESAIVLASHYCKKSNRDCVTATDIDYALKYCARNVLGQQLGTLYPEIYENTEDDCSEDDYVVVDEDDETPFSRYSGEDELMNKINNCWDTWDEWCPIGPAAKILKGAIDSRK